MTNGDGDMRPTPGRAAAPTLPKRFYSAARTAPAEDGFALLLDGRPARTPQRNPLVMPTKALADALAAEWETAAEFIDPRKMPLTRLVNTTIDGVRDRQDAVLAEVHRFAGSDLVSYRADAPAELVEAQRAAWDPVVSWFQQHYGAAFVVATGVVHVEQPPQSLARVELALRDLAGRGSAAPYRVAALHAMTTLMGSALLAIAVAAGRLTDEAAWSAAHVDEDFQTSQWGEDVEAAPRRVARFEEMRAAGQVFRLVAGI